MPTSAKDIFLAALDLPKEARPAWLDDACSGDDALRGQVETLLRMHEEPDSLLDQPRIELDLGVGPASPPPSMAPVADALITEAPGTVIGPYRLLEQIGEGGFGVVFMAEQTAPVKRMVALKVVKPGMDTRQVIARFDAERQALALMDHPNIARVLDAGTTETGRPFFVMELVKGVPITEFCDQHQHSPRERLELFVTVCQAVQHAHQKGIIHRDIKPTNVLVTLHDERPVVKVIDFGVAKAMSGQLTDLTLFTGFAQLIGTPLYMSPEQASMNGLDVDTRSDIYSLGVLLYELLTGTTPFDKARLQQAAFDEVRRIIREEEPQKPSTRLSSLESSRHTPCAVESEGVPGSRANGTPSVPSTSLASIAAVRKMEPRKLSQLLRGDLDWIVMKALEKDRGRRYETAAGFASDVLHYLGDEPVTARPPSNWYRFRKLARRNRGAFMAVTAAVLAVLLGGTTLAVSNYLIRQEQARTRDEERRADEARQLAEDRAGEIRDSLERLKAANAWVEQGRWYVQMQQWDDADAAYTKAVELRPDHAAAWVERGDLYAQLGLWDLANTDFAQEFELREPDATVRWYRHALLCLTLGDIKGYRQVRARMRERFRGTLDGYFATDVVRTSVLEDDSGRELQTAVDLARRAVEAGPGQWYPLYLLGLAEYRSGEYEQAALRLQESLTAQPEWTGRALSNPVLAMTHHRLGQTAQARQDLESAAEAIDRWTQDRYAGPEGGNWVIHQGASVQWPVAWWDWLECRLLYREARQLIDGFPPPDDPRLHVLRARALAGLRRHSAADLEYAAALQFWPDDPRVRLEAHRCAAYAAVARRDWNDAAVQFTRAGELAPGDARLQQFRAVALLGAGNIDDYRRCCRELLDRFDATTDPRTAVDVVYTCILGPDALSDLQRLLPLAEVASAVDGGRCLLGATQYRAGCYDESLQSLEAGARILRLRAGDWCILAMAHHRMGHGDEASRCLAEAARWIETANHQTENDLGATRPAWGVWTERVVYPLLFLEAEELLREDSSLRSQEPQQTDK